jgi:hypothetical protein
VVVATRRTFFIPMFDFSPECKDDINRWFDMDHVPERLTVPGFIGAERYEMANVTLPGGTSKRPPTYLNIYELTHPEVLLSEAYRRQVGHRTAWSKRRQGTVPPGGQTMLMRDVWVQRPSPWEAVTPPRFSTTVGPKSLFVLFFNPPAEHEENFNRFMDEEHVADRLSCPGFLHTERYQRADLELPGPPPPAPSYKYINIYYLASPEVMAGAPYADMFAHNSEWSQRNAASPGWNTPDMPTMRGVYVQRASPWYIRSC